MKNVCIRRLFCSVLSILMLFLVLAPVDTYAYSQDVTMTMTIGETKDISAPSYTTFSYEWSISSGSEYISIQSGTSSKTCTVKAVKAGNAVLKVVYTRSGRLTRSYTNTYNITVKEAEYTVKLNANGGSVYPSSTKVKNNDVITLPTPSRVGYTFLGWFTADTNGTQIKSGTRVSISGDMTLYAHWKKNAVPTPTPTPTTKPDDPNDPFCRTCGGLGDCPKCYGEGTVPCGSCRGSGYCSWCDGLGHYFGLYNGQYVERDCAHCYFGHCTKCGGDGEVTCGFCHGGESCPTCHGSGLKPGRTL